MATEWIHRFEDNGRRYAMDPDTCFCFECDAISWDVLEYYPATPLNRIHYLLREKYSTKELNEVIGEIEWLRATKSILSVSKREDYFKAFEVERGLKRLSVLLSSSSEPTERRSRFSFRRETATAPAVKNDEIAEAAITLLLGRSAEQPELRIEFIEDGGISEPPRMARLCKKALHAAGLVGKKLTAVVQVRDLVLPQCPQALAGHGLSIQLEFQTGEPMQKRIEAFAKAVQEPLPRLVKMLNDGDNSITLRAILEPRHADFSKAVSELHEAGFQVIELNLENGYVRNPKLEPASMFSGLRETAVYYAQRLLKHDYFRLDPIATTFWRIYNGAPVRRNDPTGTNSLYVDASGGIYPSFGLRQKSFCAGSVLDGTIDESKLKPFEDLGVMTTAPCLRCWARGLCGGGPAAVHHILSGSFRQPFEPWCEAQRSWSASAVAAFNILSSAGVHFARIYNSLTRTAKPSFFNLLRAAFKMTIGVRPIEEADAARLTRWENWSNASYFVLNESSVLVGTEYEREMAAIHPDKLEQELFLVRKNGNPFGLIRIRPDRIPGFAYAWIYMRSKDDYQSDSVRKGFRALIEEAARQQNIRRILVQTAGYETPLHDFLKAVGFASAGTIREGLFLHANYHDVPVFLMLLKENDKY